MLDRLNTPEHQLSPFLLEIYILLWFGDKDRTGDTTQILCLVNTWCSQCYQTLMLPAKDKSSLADSYEWSRLISQLVHGETIYLDYIVIIIISEYYSIMSKILEVSCMVDHMVDHMLIKMAVNWTNTLVLVITEACRCFHSA